MKDVLSQLLNAVDRQKGDQPLCLAWDFSVLQSGQFWENWGSWSPSGTVCSCQDLQEWSQLHKAIEHKVMSLHNGSHPITDLWGNIQGLAIWAQPRVSLKNIPAPELPVGPGKAVAELVSQPDLSWVLVSPCPFHTSGSQGFFSMNILDVELYHEDCFPGNPN